MIRDFDSAITTKVTLIALWLSDGGTDRYVMRFLNPPPTIVDVVVDGANRLRLASYAASLRYRSLAISAIARTSRPISFSGDSTSNRYFNERLPGLVWL